MSETVGVTGSQLRRWRELKNLTRAQLVSLIGHRHRDRSTDTVKHIEEAPDKWIPQWLVQALSMGKVKRTTIECCMDLYDWAQADAIGEAPEAEPHSLVEELSDSPEPVAVDVDEPMFIAQLLRRQGYEVRTEDVRGWIRGKTPPADVGTALKSIKQNLGYLVRAAQAQNVVRGVFGDATFAAIAKEDSFDRRMLSDVELRRAQGEETIDLEHEMRLPRRYYAITKQLARAVRLNTSEFINLWLERSLETVLQCTRIKTKYDELGMLPRQSRRNLFKFAVKRDILSGEGRQAGEWTGEKDV